MPGLNSKFVSINKRGIYYLLKIFFFCINYCNITYHEENSWDISQFLSWDKSPVGIFKCMVTYDENLQKEPKGPKEYLRQEVRQATNTEITDSWKWAYFFTNITQSLMDDTEYSKLIYQIKNYWLSFFWTNNLVSSHQHLRRI